MTEKEMECFIEGVKICKRETEELNEKLKAQFEKLLEFCLNYVDECDVCELTDTCINSEGVCPFAGSNRNIKKLIIRHINRS